VLTKLIVIFDSDYVRRSLSLLTRAYISGKMVRVRWPCETHPRAQQSVSKIRLKTGRVIAFRRLPNRLSWKAIGPIAEWDMAIAIQRMERRPANVSTGRM
jgi:hypothetical protein